MANVRLHPKTGIYQYRRAVPEPLRNVALQVEGFPTKVGRTEFTKTLGTRSKAEANKAAARVDELVDAAFEKAKARFVAPPAGADPVLASVAADGQASPPSLDPRTAFAALARWEAKAIRAAEVRMFNCPMPQRLGDEDAKRSTLIDALRRRPMRVTRAWTLVPGFDERLAEALASEKLPVAADHPALVRLRDDFAARWEAVLLAESKMRMGAWEWSDDEPEPPVASTIEVVAEHPSVSRQRTKGVMVEAMLSDYLAELRHISTPAKTISDKRRVFDRFVEFVGQTVEARAIESDAIRAFRDQALKLPSRPKLSDRELPIKTLERKYAGQAPHGLLSRKTVSKWLDFLHAGFEHGLRAKQVAENPVFHAKFRRKRTAQPPTRSAFTIPEMEVIFASPLFRGCAGPTREHVFGDQMLWGAKYWIMLLAAQSGARLNELGQMHLADVRRDPRTGIHILNITDESEQPVETEKRVKTQTSKRMLPLHQRLIDLGFLDYVEAQRATGTPYLFPELDHGRPYEPTKNLSRWFGRYFDRIGVTDTRKVSHSFRHWIKTELRQADINRDVSDHLTGHAPGDVSGRYGSAPSLTELHAVVHRLPLAFLDALPRAKRPTLSEATRVRSSKTLREAR